MINAWSRVSVIRELKHEMREAARAPLSHNAYNSHRVAPQVELAFLERRIHHLKVVGLTLIVESLPFAMMGFGKLYRHNVVQNNLLQLVSCGVSAFWVGSKITRLIGIPEYREKVRRLEEDAANQADWEEYHQAKHGKVDNRCTQKEKRETDSDGTDGEDADAAADKWTGRHSDQRARFDQHQPGRPEAFSHKMIELLHGHEHTAGRRDADGQESACHEDRNTSKTDTVDAGDAPIANEHAADKRNAPPSLTEYVAAHRPTRNSKQGEE